MNYSLLVSDFDGTLVGPDYSLSSRVRDAIGRFVQAGGKFAIATSKPFAGVVSGVCNSLGIYGPHVVNGGAEIVDSTGTAIRTMYLSWDDIGKATGILTARGFMPRVYKSGCEYTDDQSADRGAHISRYPLSALPWGAGAPKIRFSFAAGQENEAYETAGALKNAVAWATVVRNDVGYELGYDMTSGQATKAIAVSRLADIVGIPLSKIAFVGDGYNDGSTLCECGLPVSMATAPSHVMAYTRHTVPSVRDDGVAVLIDGLLSGELA